MGKKIIPQYVKDAVIRQYQDEEIGMAKLGDRFGVSSNAVCRWLREAGIPTRRVGLKVGCKSHSRYTPYPQARM